MAFVAVPKDLNRVKSKIAFNLTKRQIICFGAAALVGIPFYVATKDVLGVSTSGLFMILIMLPFFFLAMFEKDGLPFEAILLNYIRFVLSNQIRTYQTDNFYSQLEGLADSDEEVKPIEKKHHKKECCRKHKKACRI